MWSNTMVGRRTLYYDSQIPWGWLIAVPFEEKNGIQITKICLYFGVQTIRVNESRRGVCDVVSIEQPQFP